MPLRTARSFARRCRIHIVLFLCGLLGAANAWGQSAENVAVIINEASPASVRIGEYYAQVRKIPATNVIRIRTTEEEQIERPAYEQTIEGPIARALTRAGLQDRILYLVLTKGVPLRIAGTAGRSGTGASVDSELTLVYRRMTGRQVSIAGSVSNPYFLGASSVADAKPFTHRQHDIYLVTRLDGFTVEDAIALVDRAQAAKPAGKVVLDQRSGLADVIGDRWLGDAAARLRTTIGPERVMLESTGKAARDIDDVIGYFSWGSNDPQNLGRRVGMRFLPGALAGSFLSSDARTFVAPPDEWLPTETAPLGSKGAYAGSLQSLIGDLLKEGATGAAGHVAEPYMDGAVRPDILFPAYLAGFNLAEAFYLALPNLGWQTVVIGDPLCAPFRKRVLTTSEIETPMVPDTELPAFFSKRRIEVAQALLKDLPAEAVTLTVQAETRLSRGDSDGARRSLVAATEIAPMAVGANTRLAEMYEQAGDEDQAVIRYRRVIDAQPKNILALNNLAYILAVKKGLPAEGLPFARKAASLAPRIPAVVDTLAWIEHLLGNHKEAARLIAPLVNRGAAAAEIHLHAAFIFVDAGDSSLARAQLDQALRLDKNLASREDVKALRSRLESGRLALQTDRHALASVEHTVQR